MPDAIDAPTLPQDTSPEGKGEPRTKRLDFAQRAILLRYLQTHPDDTPHAIAVKLGHSPHTVNAYRGMLAADAKAMAQSVMATDILPALEEWAAARTVSALKGDHRPSKEWLIAAQAIDPDTARASVAVGFQVVLAPSPGTPAYVNASASAVVSETSTVQRVPAHAAAVTPAPDSTTDSVTDDTPHDANRLLNTAPPHRSAYIASASGVRTPLDATAGTAATPTPPAQRLHPRSRVRR